MGKTASRAPTTISSRNRPRSRGFTLIEIMIVLAIVSMVLAVGLPAISRVTYQRINSQTRKFVGLIRTLRNDSILLNTVHRLVIDMEHQRYWIEEQKEFKLLALEPEPPKKKRKASDEPPPSNFALAAKFGKEPEPLPGGVSFNGVLKEREGLRKEGVVYIHFFPNGFAEQSVIYLGREGTPGNAYSIVIRPTAGRVDVESRTVENFD